MVAGAEEEENREMEVKVRRKERIIKTMRGRK